MPLSSAIDARGSVRPRFLRSARPAPVAGLPGTLLAVLFQLAFIFASAHLLGVGQAVAAALDWISEVT